ncbi:MAG: DUF4147 domain-containing protein [Litoreibacter sp.]|nr:DUF4147 domain-containing protein [Litoreibacter sp.]
MRETLRAAARQLFEVAIGAADPAAALKRQLEAHPIDMDPGGKLFVIAVGKAACPMMREALRHVPQGAQCRALAVTNYENEAAIAGCTVITAGHPVPDENGLKAGAGVIALLEEAQAEDTVIALISGGGSALLPAPVAGVSLADKARVSELLLAAGVDINQMNMVRQQLSRLKGGGMTALAAPARVEAFILSDVIGDDLRAIASGPTASPIGTRETARKLLEDLGIFEKMPSSVQEVLSQSERDTPPATPAKNHLICSNRRSLEAMLDAAQGWRARIVADDLTGNVAEVAPELADIAKTAQPGEALLFGGETTVTLTGTGLGGRNQDLALRMALAADALGEDWVFLSGGTDGRDGPTEAAGGLVDGTTLARIAQAGEDAAACLANNDSNRALNAAGDLVITGGTGTNVADVQIFLRGPAPQ